MTTQTSKSKALNLISRSPSAKRPPPLHPDDLEPLLSASLRVQFSPALLSPHVRFPNTPPPKASPNTARLPKGYDHKASIVILSPRADSMRTPIPEIVYPEQVEEVQYAFETTKFPADVPTATFDTSKFSSSDSSASDSDDYAGYKQPTQRSVRFSLPAPRSPIPRARTQEEIDRALSFLPYPGSPRPPKTKVPRLNTRLSLRKGASALPSHGKLERNRRPTELLSDSDIPGFAPPGLMGPTKLSPVPEVPSTPSVTAECLSSADESSDSTTSTTLNTAFWGSVTVQQNFSDEEGNASSQSDASASEDAVRSSLHLVPPTMPSPALLSPQPPSPYPLFLFGRSRGTLWSPNFPHGKPRASPSDFVGSPFPYSPATTATAANTFHAMTSPVPNDPMYASLLSALEHIEADGVITFPPGVELRDPPPRRVRK
jgi:hypothetical protein